MLACQYSILDHEEALKNTFPALPAKGITVTLGTPLNDGFLGGRNRNHFSDKLPTGVVEKRARLSAVADRHGIDIIASGLLGASGLHWLEWNRRMPFQKWY